MDSMEYARLRREKRLRSGKIMTIIAVCYTLLTAFSFLFADHLPFYVMYISPSTLFFEFMRLIVYAQTPSLIVTYVLVLLPVVGCVLLSQHKRVGRQLILVPQILLLTAAVVVTVLHMIIGAGMWRSELVRDALFLSISALVVPIFTLWALHRWSSNIRYE